MFDLSRREGFFKHAISVLQFPFHDLDNIVMSPHRGADSGGDLNRWDEVVENIKRVNDGRDDYLNVVDLHLEY